MAAGWTKERAGALMVLSRSMFFARRARLAQLADKNRLRLISRRAGTCRRGEADPAAHRGELHRIGEEVQQDLFHLPERVAAAEDLPEDTRDLRENWQATAWAKEDGSDELSRRITTAVDEIEALCRKHLR